MNEKIDKVCSYDEAKEFLDHYGDFHDCIIKCLTQNFFEKRLEIQIDDLFSGIELDKIQPGILVFEQIEYLACQTPYVGGQIRIEGAELIKSEKGGLKLEFDLTTTEWVDSEEFKAIKVGVEAKKIFIRKHFEKI